jgi:hypothetical protein
VSAPDDRGTELRFTPTSGTFTGWIAITAAVVAIVAIGVDMRTLTGIRYALAAAIFGLLAWCFMLRPRVVIGSVELELRNVFSSWHVPLAAVRKVAVRAITRVYTDDGEYDAVAVGRPIRSMRRGRRSNVQTIGLPGLGRTIEQDIGPTPEQVKGRLDADAVADLVLEQILQSADTARSAAHEASAPPRRTWARIELAALALLTAGLVVSLLL